MTAGVLLVEDEENLASLVSAYLEQEGYRVASVGTGADALRTLEQTPVRLVVLDLNLPDIDGLDVCRQIRIRSSVPIVMLTARDEEADRLAGLGAGADDYIGKPFSPRELVARMKAVLRRAEPHADEQVLVLGDIVLQRDAREVGVSGELVELGPKEVDLLAYLMQNRGVVVSGAPLAGPGRGSGYAGRARA